MQISSIIFYCNAELSHHHVLLLKPIMCAPCLRVLCHLFSGDSLNDGIWNCVFSLLLQGTFCPHRMCVCVFSPFCPHLLCICVFSPFSVVLIVISHSMSFRCLFIVWLPGGSDGKASAYNAGDPGLIPGLGRAPGEGNSNPLQYSCLENSMDGGTW